MKTARKEVARFWLQPTPSFPEGAPQRESYMTDEACDRADVRYADEWRAMYHCAGCDDVNCPQCGAQGSRSVPAPTAQAHEISIRCEPPSRNGALVLQGGHRARCSCTWSSDCYAQLSDTQRAVEVHLRKAKREDFEELLARSSIGTALADIKARGIDAHLIDLEREMTPKRRRKQKGRT
jgi:hypothetical protein